MAVSGVARLQGSQPAAFFYLCGHTTPYAYGRKRENKEMNRKQRKKIFASSRFRIWYLEMFSKRWDKNPGVEAEL
jgi:hypothetical protein